MGAAGARADAATRLTTGNMKGKASQQADYKELRKSDERIAKAEQRLRKIKELMKTDHVRRFAPLLTGQQAPEAPAG